MQELSKREAVALDISRKAADLFLERGVAGTSGDDIAAACGVSTRTIWRHFRTKESSVEPLLAATSYRIVTWMTAWPAEMSVEDYLHEALRPDQQTPQERADDIMAVRIIALIRQEPALRTAWLMACSAAEADLAGIVARRAGRPVNAFDVRLCAATVMAAIRLVNEEFSAAAVLRGETYTLQQVVDKLAASIREACTLPICDPVSPH